MAWEIGAYIFESFTLVVADVSLALSYEAPVLTQAHTLVVGDMALSLTLESPDATENVISVDANRIARIIFVLK